MKKRKKVILKSLLNGDIGYNTSQERMISSHILKDYKNIK